MSIEEIRNFQADTNRKIEAIEQRSIQLVNKSIESLARNDQLFRRSREALKASRDMLHKGVK